MTRFTQFKNHVLASVERRLQEGWYLRPGCTIDNRGSCCLVGALALEDESIATAENPLEAFHGYDYDGRNKLAAKLNISYRKLQAIEAGFEGWPTCDSDTELYKFGAFIRTHYVETK